LETDMSYIVCKEDERTFDTDKLLLFIEENHQRNIVFFCDNNQFKQIIKFKYDQIIITDCNIGHTSLYNTTDDQILDTISEFYIMCNSSHIYSATPYFSGFAAMAAKFKNIPISDI
jgi:predicted double-glycine peptidase